ncbi:MAG: hypothetical protein WC054_05515 [Candidatus Nanopelagicales bacterium]
MSESDTWDPPVPRNRWDDLDLIDQIRMTIMGMRFDGDVMSSVDAALICSLLVDGCDVHCDTVGRDKAVTDRKHQLALLILREL